MTANELANALKCHVMRHGDCDVELQIKLHAKKKGVNYVTTDLYILEHEDTDKHPRVILKGKV